MTLNFQKLIFVFDTLGIYYVVCFELAFFQGWFNETMLYCIALCMIPKICGQECVPSVIRFLHELDRLQKRIRKDCSICLYEIPVEQKDFTMASLFFCDGHTPACNMGNFAGRNNRDSVFK